MLREETAARAAHAADGCRYLKTAATTTTSTSL
jgi:hypothetical protein